MLYVNVHRNLGSMGSEYSGASKSYQKTSMLKRASQNRGFLSRPKSINNKKSNKSPVNISRSDVDIEISIAEGVYTPKIDHLFQDFSENSIQELSHGFNVNRPLQFKPNCMNLKNL